MPADEGDVIKVTFGSNPSWHIKCPYAVARKFDSSFRDDLISVDILHVYLVPENPYREFGSELLDTLTLYPDEYEIVRRADANQTN